MQTETVRTQGGNRLTRQLMIRRTRNVFRVPAEDSPEVEREVFLDAVKGLFVSVLMRAVQDLQTVAHRRDAVAWFFRDDDEVFGVRGVSAALGLSVERFRREARKRM